MTMSGIKAKRKQLVRKTLMRAKAQGERAAEQRQESPEEYAQTEVQQGISDIHPHMFRHTFVSLLMSNPDIGVATVAAEAGHAQPSTTLMIYTQQYKKRRESIRNQLSRELYEK